MNKLTKAALIGLLALNTMSADLRDASLKGTSDTVNFTLDKANSSFKATVDAAEVSAEKLKAFFSKNFASSIEASGKIGEMVVKVSEISEPVIELTQDGLVMSFEASKSTAEKLYIVLEPSSDVSSEVLGELLKHASKGSESTSDLISEIVDILSKTFEKPLELTEMTVEKLLEVITKGSEASTEVTESILGEENLDNAFELTGKGISVTSQGISAALYFVTKTVSGISRIFDVYREEVEQAVERQDEDMLAGIRDMIRAEIEKEVKGGETLNKVISDDALNVYIETQLAM
ncbi:MAG: hypothetical protein BM556_13995 [Bacteriovorax sp. MedPE-SWde]|nr:MAG: hypothetical protein BM556_13995 [Bacteriovorax sp. MedPE-SWde]